MEDYKETINLDITETLLARADGDEGTEWVGLYELRFPWDDYHFDSRRFYVVRHRIMDFDNDCWDRIFNDLRSAMACFGKEANRKFRWCGCDETVKRYKPVEYCKSWWAWRDELVPDDEPRCRSSSARDYSPSNPWDAPGMKISDFIGGVV